MANSKAGNRFTTLASQFDDEDWCEIYNCVGGELQEKMTVDGKGMSRSRISRFTETDWIEMYLSVEDKLALLRTGFYGRDAMARKWADQFERILDNLSPVRKEYIAA